MPTGYVGPGGQWVAPSDTRIYGQSEGPAMGVFAITPDDSNDLPNGPCRGIRCTVAGNAAIVDANGNDATYPLNVGDNAVGTKRVKSTGTTATGLFALY